MVGVLPDAFASAPPADELADAPPWKLVVLAGTGAVVSGARGSLCHVEPERAVPDPPAETVRLRASMAVPTGTPWAAPKAAGCCVWLLLLELAASRSSASRRESSHTGWMADAPLIPMNVLRLDIMSAERCWCAHRRWC